MTGRASFLLALAVLGIAEAHDWGMGSCPRVDPVPNLSVEKFLGLWYVIQQVDTDSLCLKLNYTRVSETQLRVTKLRQFSILDQVGVEHTNSYSGTLDLPHEDDLGRMRVKWPLNVAGKGDYIVFDTDYTNYAGIYECQTVTTLMHRKSAAILSRTPVLAQEYIDRVRRRLTSFGISLDDLDTVVHQGCRTRAEADVNIHVDSDTFSSVMSGARTGIEDAASSVGQGFKDLASTFSWIGGDAVSNVQNTFGISSPKPNTNVGTVEDTVDKTLVPGVEIVGVPLSAAGGGVQKSADSAGDVTVPSTAGLPTADTTRGVETVEGALEAAFESVDETAKDVNEAVNENVDSGLNGANDIANEILEEGPAGTEGRYNKVDLQENFYNIDNAAVEPVDDIIRTVVSIDKKK